MRIATLSLGAVLLASGPAPACEPGVYSDPHGSGRAAVHAAANGLRYTFTDGRRGRFGETRSLLRCDVGRVVGADGVAWRADPMRITETTFESHGSRLTGVLLESATHGTDAPLVVVVHGSEKTSPMAGAYPWVLAALGLRVFAYDKRGTGRSAGEYTQNFELLADDAAAALSEARRMTGGGRGRAGFFGGSQGGWVAPLAASRSEADFVAVGFGLVLSPLEEDREQALAELRAAGFGGADLAAAEEVTRATARLVASHFGEGYDMLAEARRRHADRPWLHRLRGEYTGDILKMSEADLRRVGRARFDNLELIWDHDAAAALRALDAPLLWVLAEEDREAPPDLTRARLKALRAEGVRIDLFSFPDTDHGMVEFTETEAGERRYGRITEGYFALLADWIMGEASGSYGRSRRD